MKYLILLLCELVGTINFDDEVIKYYFDDGNILG